MGLEKPAWDGKLNRGFEIPPHSGFLHPREFPDLWNWVRALIIALVEEI